MVGRAIAFGELGLRSCSSDSPALLSSGVLPFAESRELDSFVAARRDDALEPDGAAVSDESAVSSSALIVALMGPDASHPAISSRQDTASIPEKTLYRGRLAEDPTCIGSVEQREPVFVAYCE